MNLRQLPNAITCLRIASALPLAWSIGRGADAEALLIAALAGGSDALDGFLARRYGWQTRLGGLLDPLADKVLVAACFVALWSSGAVPGWWLALLLGRDALIVAGALAYQRFVGPVDGQPTRLGKLTTMLQLGFALALLVQRAGAPIPAPWLDAGLVAVALVTVASGVDYVVQWGTSALRRSRDVA